MHIILIYLEICPGLSDLGFLLFVCFPPHLCLLLIKFGSQDHRASAPPTIVYALVFQITTIQDTSATVLSEE